MFMPVLCVCYYVVWFSVIPFFSGIIPQSSRYSKQIDASEIPETSESDPDPPHQKRESSGRCRRPDIWKGIYYVDELSSMTSLTIFYDVISSWIFKRIDSSKSHSVDLLFIKWIPQLETTQIFTCRSISLIWILWSGYLYISMSSYCLSGQVSYGSACRDGTSPFCFACLLFLAVCYFGFRRLTSPTSV